MKICRNEFDIILYPVTRCYQCAFKAYTSHCLWLRIASIKTSLGCCDGIRTDVLSDIFKL